MNSSVLQNQRNNKKHTFSIAVSLRAVALAFFPNTHDKWPLTETKSMTNYGRVSRDGSSLNVYENLSFLCIVFSGRKSGLIFLTKTSVIESSRSKLPV